MHGLENSINDIIDEQDPGKGTVNIKCLIKARSDSQETLNFITDDLVIFKKNIVLLSEKVGNLNEKEIQENLQER